ncbi:hypothetical protein GR294_23380 [Raoultella sp. Lac2]|uniref:hypothetical protein n=1 Tax=unclassified Raoultella TaxID=2627600 RepID=UPI0013528412|nr:hypothetical protein [Raoultella sp. Lac2]MXF98705.1 hypothetical protein [Raoultella sp. Lac1]
MKKYLLALLLCPIVVSAGTLEDFFTQHPDLYNNIHTRNAIKSTARVATIDDVSLQKKDGEMSGQVMTRLLKEDGDSYAQIALRILENQCEQGVAMEASQLKDDDCKLILRESK